jgi:anti-sigma-K factor RskA
MSHLDPDRLSLIALGEPATDEERAHLDTCDECALELAELEYTVIVGRSTVGVGDLEAPPERVWAGIAEELGLGAADRMSTAGGIPAADERERAATADEPERASAAASVSADEGSPGAPAPARRKRGTRIVFALAASIALIVAAVGTWTLVRETQPVEIAAATLDAFPAHPDASGTAVIVEKPDGARQVQVDLEAAEPSDGFREVWLITEDASALVSLGLLEGSTGVFPVPDDIDLREYVLVDISQEPADGDPTHSGDSIVRGELQRT